MDKKEKLILIDGNSLINRAFYALPLLKNSEGEYSNAVYGFCNILIKLIETEKPKYFAVAFDLGHPTFRHEMYPEYKAGRRKMADELAVQIPVLKDTLKKMNITFVEQKGIEADDLIGTLAKKFKIPTIIVSGDRDLFQLVDDTTSVWYTKRGISETIVVTPQNVKEVFGVNANQVVDLKSLMGDSSDNIKGVTGIGPKIAIPLLEKYGTVENIYEHIDELAPSYKKHLIEGEEDQKLSKILATIKTDVELNLELEDLTYDFPFKREVYEQFKHYDFFTLLKRDELFDKTEVKIDAKIVNKKYIKTEKELDDLVKNLSTTNKIALDYLDDCLHVANSKFEENIIKIDKNSLNLPLFSLKNENSFTLTEILNKFDAIFKDEKIVKYFVDAKRFMHDINCDVCGIKFDANICYYLLSGSQKTDIESAYFAQKFGYDADSVAVSLLSAYEELSKKIADENMTYLFEKIELPLTRVLFDMEQNGFKVDVEALKKVGQEYEEELKILTQKIYIDAGEEFNVKSPKQMAEVLFDKLSIQLPKNTKRSTGVEVLEKIYDQHPIVQKILRFRKIEKLNSTYIEPLIQMAEPKSHLIHTIFNQTLTATGRLSSSEPNLQNIPIRDDEGKKLRKIFVPRDPNGSIISSDYSQIELRLVAHFSKDEKLLEAYKNGIDVHTQTASDIFDVPIELVTDKMRRDAKAVNFGIIYGISEYGLASNINCSRYEAKQFIQKYFETYKGVKAHMDRCVENAKKDGFVTSLCGRKRVIEELNSPNYMTRLFGERAAMNMPLQGTASDIIKIAMINVFNALKKENLKSKLILQIHDELIIDTAEGEEERVKQILKTEMENAFKLDVPLVAQISMGKNWFEAK